MKVLSCPVKIGRSPSGQSLSVAQPKKNHIQITVLFIYFLKKMKIKCHLSGTESSYGNGFSGSLDCDTTENYLETQLTDYELSTIIIQSFVLVIMCLILLVLLCFMRNKQ